MADAKAIYNYIKGVRRKRLLLHVIYALSSSALILLVSLLLGTLLRVFIIFRAPSFLIVYILIFSASFLVIFSRRIRGTVTILQNAIYIDDRFSLKDRFSSYIDGSLRGISSDILKFQERALIVKILPSLKGRVVVDLRSHYSFKYIIVILVLLQLLSYIKTKGSSVILLTDEELKMLSREEDKMEDFVRYLKDKDLKEILTEEKINKISELYEGVRERMTDTTIDRREAIKILSKLIDNTAKILKGDSEDLRSSQAVSEFDVAELGLDRESASFMMQKQAELTESLDKLSDDLPDQSDAIKRAKESLNLMQKKTDAMEAGTKGMDDNYSAIETALKSPEMEELKEQIEEALDELSRRDTMQQMRAEQESVSDSMQMAKKLIGGAKENKSAPSDEKGDEDDPNVTFNSRIEDLERGKSGLSQGASTTNEDAGAGSSGTGASQTGELMHDMTDQKFEKIYAASRIDTRKDVLAVKGVLGEGESVTVESSKALPMGTPVTTPYNEVYGEYKEAAQKAVTAQRVPKLYKEYVLEYFESINPDLR